MDYLTNDIRELRAAAFEALMFFPGCDLDGWLDILLKEYTEEVVDVLGSDPAEVVTELNRWWNEVVYEDEITGIKHKYREWAAIFKDQAAVEFYRSLVAEAVKQRENQE